MSNIVACSTVSVTETIADRIRADFVSLIPPDTWKALVQGEIDRFTKPELTWDYRESDKPSPLQEIVRDEIRRRFKQQILAYMDSPEMRDHWDSATQTNSPAKAIQEILAGLVPQIIAAQYAHAGQDIAQRIKQSMPGY